ncbi:oligodendrocyte-myelin glycoprotein [Cryptotermes secundus]|nr:oligodendrocyte-myelin glycoprotein [Cryptotermes secundus]
MFGIRVLMGILLHSACFVSVYAAGDGLATCPAGCRCNPLRSYINSIIVECSFLNLSDIPQSRPDSVHTLDLSYNVIRTLRNESFPKYIRLSTVILSYNEMEDIQVNAFAGLQMIRTIDLSYNKLKSIHPEIFASNPKLEFLSLSSNPLTHLPSKSPILVSDSVISLDLSSCFLTEIHPLTFSRLPRLCNLDLSSNLLQTVSVRSLENLPDLKTVQLANNRWNCNCDVVELMQWTSKRRRQGPAHRPVKCLEGGKYRTLWTAAGGGKSCKESTTAASFVATDMAASLAASEFVIPVVVSLATSEDDMSVVVSLATSEVAISASLVASETTTDISSSLVASETTNDRSASLVESETTTNIAATLRRLPFSQKITPYLSLHLAKETTVTGGDEPTVTPEIETGDWDGLLSWNANTILVFVILPCTLCVAVFLALMAVNYFTRRWTIHRPRHAIQGKGNCLENCRYFHPQLTADTIKPHARYININNQRIPYDTYHIYEEID